MAKSIPLFQLGLFADKYPVTVEEYREYNQQYKNPWSKIDDNPKLPATGITWQEAQVYATFHDKRLPTTQEWIFCATGIMLIPVRYGEGFEPVGNPRRYPWGDKEDPKRCNCAEFGKNRPTPVDYFDGKGESPFGLSDMLGNVWEMTNTFFGESVPGKPIANIDNRTIIGGYFENTLDSGGIAGQGVMKMDMLMEDSGIDIVGFRCVQDFQARDRIQFADSICKEYFAWLNMSQGTTMWSLNRSLKCDLCNDDIDAQKATAVGSNNSNISIYCQKCFIKRVSQLVSYSECDGHKIIFYGDAIAFLIAYMRGDIRGGNYVFEEGGFEKYAKRCHLRSVRPKDIKNSQELLDELRNEVFKL